MGVFELYSNHLFLEFSGADSLNVWEVKDLNSPTVQLNFKDSVGVGRTLNTLLIFNQPIKGQDLSKLASLLLRTRLIVNREGYCLIRSGITGSDANSSINAEYYRINDLFDWSEFNVTPQRSMIWDRCSIQKGGVLVNFVDKSQSSSSSSSSSSQPQPRPQPLPLIPVQPVPAASVVGGGGYTFTAEEATRVIRAWRRTPPSDFLFEITSLKSLIKALPQSCSDKAFESPEFSAAGHIWVLSICFQGNHDDGADGYLSLYLRRIHDKLNRARPIDVILRFFILDQRRGQYLAVQDSTVRHFDIVSCKWGIPQVLPVADFNKASNGFVKGDTCIFGVEVFVVKDDPETTGLTMKQRIANHIHPWHIPDLKRLQDEAYSKFFQVEGHSWRLVLYPKGYMDGEQNSLSLYLELKDHSKLSRGRNLFVNFELTLKHINNNTKDHKHSCVGWFGSKEYTMGFDQFIPLSVFHNPNNGFIPAGNSAMSINLEVDFKAIFFLQDI